MTDSLTQPSDRPGAVAEPAASTAVPRPRRQPSGGPGQAGSSRRPRATGSARRARFRRGTGRGELKTSTALLQFSLAGVLVLVLLATVGMVALRSVAQKEAISQAVELTDDRARLLVEPALTDALVAGDPAALRTFDRRVRDGLLGPRVARIKLWDATGRVVWSDLSKLIGLRFALDAEDRATLRTGDIDADISNLQRPENQYDPSGPLLQVYERVRTPSGQPLLFEVYLQFASISASAREMARAVGPAFLLALVVLELLQLPLAWRLVRRIQRGQRERDVLHHKVVEASDEERRRIARDLHDGVVQSLAGISFSLAAATEELEPLSDNLVVAGARAKVAAAAGGARRNVGELRTLISEIYPPELEGAGLATALGDLLAPLESLGIATSISVPPVVSVSRDEAAVVYRAAQEALRNVVAHAEARHVAVTVTESPGQLDLTVSDDGRGFDPALVPELDDRPHFGLRLLEGLAREVDGRMEVESMPGAGTTFFLQIPVQ